MLRVQGITVALRLGGGEDGQQQDDHHSQDNAVWQLSHRGTASERQAVAGVRTVSGDTKW